DHEQRDGVLLAHGPAIEVLSGADAGVNDYLDELERASKNTSAWSLVRDDPVGLVVWINIKNQDLLDYYGRERDWLAPVTAESTPDAKTLTHSIETAKEFHPLVKQAIVDLKLGRAGFELFLEHGALINSAVTAKLIPLDETLEVIFASRDLVSVRQKDQS